MSTLYIIAAPFNNLEDISMKALRILDGVDFILCEDAEAIKKFLAHYHIKTPVFSYSGLKKTDYILDLLKQRKKLAFVAGAGMPAPSEAGGKLAQAVKERLGDDVSIEFVLGPSAITAALSMSGIPIDKFVFMGFPPHEKGRRTFIRKILASEWPVVVYESKRRIIKFLEEIDKTAESRQQTADEDEIKNSKFEILNSKISSVVVCRELSKMHETVYRGDINSIIEKIKNNKDDQKGEFVVIVGK